MPQKCMLCETNCDRACCTCGAGAPRIFDDICEGKEMDLALKNLDKEMTRREELEGAMESLRQAAEPFHCETVSIPFDVYDKVMSVYLKKDR